MARRFIDLKSIQKRLDEIGTDYALQLKSQLLNVRKRATGSLEKSITSTTEITDNDGGFIVEISAAKHLTYVDKGRRPGAKMPPIQPIAAWLKVKGIPASPWAVAKSIAKNGIAATNVIDKTMEEMQRSRNKDIHTAIAKEVAAALEKFAADTANQLQRNRNVTARMRRR